MLLICLATSALFVVCGHVFIYAFKMKFLLGLNGIPYIYRSGTLDLSA